MPLTNETAMARAYDMIGTIGTLSDGLAQRNAAQTIFYVTSLHDSGLVSSEQLEELVAATKRALSDWEQCHPSVNPRQTDSCDYL